jgi:beta-phosphoglucomutase-like phosphatase (HAD superfamily)
VDANLQAAGFTNEDFGAVISGASFQRNKPAPDVFLAAAEAMGLPPAECVVLEDAPAGVQAARAAGMRVVGVTTTLSAAEMAAEGPDTVFGEVGDMRVEDVIGLQYAQQPMSAASQQ